MNVVTVVERNGNLSSAHFSSAAEAEDVARKVHVLMGI